MGKTISIIFLVLFAPVFFALVIFTTLKLTVMNPGFVKEELSEQKAYEKIHANLFEIADAIGGKEDEASGDQGALAVDELAAAIQKTVTPEVAQEKTEMVIDTFWSWIFSGENGKTVDMRALKTDIRADIMDAFKSKYESLPKCLNYSDYSENNIVCRPDGVSFDDIMVQLTNGKEDNPFSVIDNIPDDLNPEDLLPDKEDEPIVRLASMRSQIKPVFAFFYLFPLLLLAVFILFARLFAGNWEKTPKTLGIFMIILGTMSLVFGLAARYIGSSEVSSLTNKGFNNVPNLKAQLIVPMTEDIAVRVSNTLSIVSVSVLVFGIVLVGVSMIILKVTSSDGNTLKEEE